MTRLEEGFERLAPPRKGEWRSLFPEKEQTFDQYVAGCANRRSAARSVFYLQPLGAAAAAIDRMAGYAAAFFGLETRVCEPRPLFEPAHIPLRGQYNSSMLLDELSGAAPADAIVYLGITDRDLFARGKTFVFGEGSLERRTGICSLARLASPDAELFDRRALKLMTHEAGHILSIAHCVTWRCVMQGSNTLEESDGHPLHLCPEDLRKLAWNTGVDLDERARRLRSLTEEYGWGGFGAPGSSLKRSVLDARREG